MLANYQLAKSASLEKLRHRAAEKSPPVRGEAYLGGLRLVAATAHTMRGSTLPRVIVCFRDACSASPLLRPPLHGLKKTEALSQGTILTIISPSILIPSSASSGRVSATRESSGAEVERSNAVSG